MPSLNGYGTLEGTLSDDENEQNVTVDTAAESFVRDGLSKVMKITNVCDNEHLTDCGLPDKIIPNGGGSAINLSSITSLNKYNNTFGGEGAESDGKKYEQLNTKAASFETVNGESILVYYNPNCEADYKEIGMDWYFAQNKMCANFIYDLNGKKGPNTFGKDIGFITALYSTDPNIVAPIPYSTKTDGKFNQSESMDVCRNLGDDYKLPSKDELLALSYNKILFNPNNNGDAFWSSTKARTLAYWTVRIGTGGIYPTNESNSWHAWCIKR